MPAAALTLTPVVRKPAAGARLNGGHPLARGLLHGWFLNEGAGLVSRGLAVGDASLSRVGAGAVWGASGGGLGAQVSGAGGYLQATGHQRSTWSHALLYVPQSVASQTLLDMAEGSAGAFTHDRAIYLDASGHAAAYVYDGAEKAAVGTHAFVARRPVWVVVTADTTNLTLYLNGVQEAQIAAGAAFAGYSAPQLIAGYAQVPAVVNGGTPAWGADGLYLAALVWSRALTAADAWLLATAPWGLLVEPPLQRIWGRAPAGGATVQSRTVTLAVTATLTPAQLAVRARTVTAPGGGTLPSAALAIRARTLAAPAGGTVTAARLAVRVRTTAPVVAATVATGQLAVRARTVAASAGGLLTAVGGVPGAVSARTLTVLLQAALTVTGVGRLALRGITQRRAGTPGPDSHRGGTSSGGKRWTL